MRNEQMITFFGGDVLLGRGEQGPERVRAQRAVRHDGWEGTASAGCRG